MKNLFANSYFQLMATLLLTRDTHS